MDAGCSLLVAGSWEAPSQGFAAGRLAASNGLVSATRAAAGRIDLKLLYPTNENSISCQVTVRGAPQDVSFSVTQTDNQTKRVTFIAGESYVDVPFDFVFVKMAEPQQGGLG